MATQFGVDILFRTQGGQQITQLTNKLTGADTVAKKLQGSVGPKLTSALNQAGRAGRAAGEAISNAFKKAGQGVTTLVTKVGSLSGKLSGVQRAVAGAGLGLYAKSAIGLAATLEDTEVRLDSLVKRYGQYNGIQSLAAASAEKFKLSTSQVNAEYADLASRLGSTGTSLQDIDNIYQGFNTLLANNRVEAQQAASAQLQLNQALGSGRLAGEEYNAINEATPQLLDEVARVLGVARGELKDLASDGKISSKVLIQALTNIRKDGAEELATAFSGTSGKLKEFNKANKEFSETVGSELVPAITPLLQQLTELLKLFGKLPGPVKSTAVAIVAVGSAALIAGPALAGLAKVLAGIVGGGLLAAAPWLALAAGIGAAVIAINNFKSARGNIAAGAIAGGAKDVVAARNELVAVNQEISLAERSLENASGQRRQSIGRRLTLLRKDAAALKSAVQQNPADIVAQTTTTTPDFSASGGGDAGTGSGGGGNSDAERAAKEAEQRRKELADLAAGNALLREERDLQNQIYNARLAGSKEAEFDLEFQNRLNKGQAKIAEITRNEPDLEKRALLIEEERLNTASALRELSYGQQQAYQDQQNTLNDLLDDLNDQIALVQTGSDEARRTLEIEQQLAKVRKANPLITDEEIEKLRAANKELDKATKKANAIKAQQQQLQSLYDGIGSEIASGVGGAIDAVAGNVDNLGEELQGLAADILKAVGKLLIFYALAQAFGALGGDDGVGFFSILAKGFGGGRASGGSTPVNTPVLVGERGPELFVPSQSGGITNNQNLRSMMSSAGAARGNQAGGGITLNVTATKIGDTDFVKVDDMQRALAETRRLAARDGAKQGEQRTLDKLRQSPRSRRSVGL